MSLNRECIAAVDLGTTQVKVAVATCSSDGFEVIGVGQVPSLGMKQGAVVHIKAMTEAVRKACEQAEAMVGVPIRSVWLGVGGTGISSFESSGMVVVRDQVVNHDDIEKVIEVAQAVFIPNDRCVLHVLPKSYKVDNQGGICDPMGMSGSRLETTACIITGSQAVVQNSLRCVENAGLRVSGLVLQSLASSMAVLTEDEKSMGVTVVDVGGGVCDLITYHQGNVVLAGAIPLGGRNFTNDVAVGFRTTLLRGEEIKKKWGHVFPDRVSEEEVIENEETFKRKNLCTILEARSEELSALIMGTLQEGELVNQLSSGLVVTGGVSHLEGFVELGDFLLEIPVRQGLPSQIIEIEQGEKLRGGEFATVLGSLNYAYQEMKKRNVSQNVFVQKWNKMSSTVKGYLNELF